MPEFAKSPYINYCFSPVRISKNGQFYYVPCGKCGGCRLNKSHAWSFRLGDEIEHNPFSIFFTLTYSNDYVPKVRCVGKQDGLYLYQSCSNDIRFNGTRDVFRQPLRFYDSNFIKAPLHNYFDNKVIGVCRKDDIQLWLKLLRKDLYDYKNICGSAFRYFVVSEYGPGKVAHKGKLRPHYHGFLFPQSEEIAEFLLYPSKEIEKFQQFGCMFSNWKMSDYDRFEQYSRYCNSGTRDYVTSYLVGSSLLPSFYENKVIKPFRLFSKQVSVIGTSHFDRKKVSEDVERGIVEYVRNISRIERNCVLRYPSQIVNSLFPKCSRYSSLSYFGLCRVYGYLYNLKKVGRTFGSVSDGLFTFSFRSSDLRVASACLRVCDMMHWSLRVYLDVLVNYYYIKEQNALRYQYQFLIEHSNDPYICILWYSNWKDYLFDFSDFFPSHHDDNVRNFFAGFGLVFSPSLELVLSSYYEKYHRNYFSEVSDIISISDKSKKANALAGLSPDF